MVEKVKAIEIQLTASAPESTVDTVIRSINQKIVPLLIISRPFVC